MMDEKKIEERIKQAQIEVLIKSYLLHCAFEEEIIEALMTEFHFSEQEAQKIYDDYCDKNKYSFPERITYEMVEERQKQYLRIKNWFDIQIHEDHIRQEAKEEAKKAERISIINRMIEVGMTKEDILHLDYTLEEYDAGKELHEKIKKRLEESKE